MSALAKRFEGTPAGDFWTVYAELERGQSPFYIELGKRHVLAPRALRTGMKAALSVEAASLFPTWFVGMLATATERYLLFLKSTRMPTERPDQVAMRYVIRQEAAPVNALKIASEGDFKAATDVLRAFVRDDRPPRF